MIGWLVRSPLDFKADAYVTVDAFTSVRTNPSYSAVQRHNHESYRRGTIEKNHGVVFFALGLENKKTTAHF